MQYLIDGIEIIGAHDSGHEEQRYILKTPDGRFIQVTQLLFHTITALQKNTDLQSAAAEISKKEKKQLNPDILTFLIEEKLRPLGLLKESPPLIPKNDTTNDVLKLHHRFTLISQSLVIRIADIFRFLFFFPIIVFTFITFGIVTIWLFLIHGISPTLQQVVADPCIFLLLLGLIILSSLFHEIGHAAGCIYSGGKPGKIGAGMYFVWPAFFTDLTDVYRLDKISRIRSDIGGIYFNMIFSLVIAGIYFCTHTEALLLVIVIQTIEIFHQLLPFFRLDGYFLVADIVGLPDLFSYIQPILKSFVFRKELHTVRNLKGWVKWTVILWVVATVSFLAYIFLLMIYTTPFILGTALHQLVNHGQIIVALFKRTDYLGMIIQSLRLIILLLPVLGILFAIYFFVRKTFFLLYMLVKISFKFPLFKRIVQSTD